MPNTPEAQQPTPAHRDRSTAARRKSRRSRMDRERRIMFLLNAGASIAEIAAEQGVSLKRMRNLVREISQRARPSRRPSISRCRSAASTRRCWCPIPRCTTQFPGRTSRRSTGWSRSCESSTAITDSRPARPRRARTIGSLRRRREPRWRLSPRRRATRNWRRNRLKRLDSDLEMARRRGPSGPSARGERSSKAGSPRAALLAPRPRPAPARRVCRAARRCET